MNIFYCAEANTNATFVLDENETHHAVAVLRMNVGDAIHVFDGKGKLYHATIHIITKKQVVVYVKELITERHLPYFLHIAIAPTKQMERLEWFVEKAVELGVSKITPVICARSERKYLKTQRLHKMALAACKQSKQLELPEICEAISFENFLESVSEKYKFIAWCETNDTSIKQDDFRHTSSVFLIGPEGDFSSTEITLAKEKSFQELSLGNSILRTETAGVLVATLMRGNF